MTAIVPIVSPSRASVAADICAWRLYMPREYAKVESALSSSASSVPVPAVSVSASATSAVSPSAVRNEQRERRRAELATPSSMPL